ncbi:MAG: hypothetical protein SGPRY_010408 [Prymnesium sp.]
MPPRRSSAAATAEGVASDLGAMLSELRARCPSLCPLVIPAGYSDSERGVPLLALASEDRSALLARIERERLKSVACDISKEKLPREQLRAASLWQISAEPCTLQLCRLCFVSREVHLLLHPELLLAEFATAQPDCAKLSELAQLFCRINGHAERCEQQWEARVWLQECVNLAYACSVLASSLSPWQVLGPDGAPLCGTALKCAEALFASDQADGTPVAKPSKLKSGKILKSDKVLKSGKLLKKRKAKSS